MEINLSHDLGWVVELGCGKIFVSWRFAIPGKRGKRSNMNMNMNNIQYLAALAPAASTDHIIPLSEHQIF
jgi:hypothetical protein